MCWGLIVGVSWRVRLLLARRVAESASLAVLDGLGVFADRRPEHLDDAQAKLRVGLRASGASSAATARCWWRSARSSSGIGCCSPGSSPRTTCCCTREFEAPVTLEDCEELAAELGEPDGWSVAARFAAEILPGIFRLDDPCVQLRLAPESREALEEILAGLPAEVFVADDALGWVYQFWQKDKKDEVNASERKIGGADLGPVTQLFTENYMVRFLLENSLGAWWAARHPDSPLIKDWEFLRFDDDGNPAAGQFRGVARHGWRGDGDGSVLRVGSLPGRSVLHVVADARRRRRPRTRSKPKTRCCADNLFGLGARSALCADRHVRGSVRRHGRPAGVARVAGAEHRLLRHPRQGVRSTTGKRWPTVTNASRTPSCASTSCSATPTRSAV